LPYSDLYYLLLLPHFLKRLPHLLNNISCQHGFLSLLFGSQVAGQSVQILADVATCA
jgi:hypothetical protein